LSKLRSPSQQRPSASPPGHSVTSPGAESSPRSRKPDALAADIIARNSQLKWCDTSQRGYLAGTKRMTVLAGQRRFTAF
jgi:hypothetical protein